MANITAKKLLIGYWLISFAMYYGYLILFKALHEISFTSMMARYPIATMVFLFSNLILAQILLLLRASSFSKSRKGTLGKFYIFTIVQQLITVNIVGAILSYHCLKRLDRIDEKQPRDWILLLGMLFIGIGSIIYVIVLVMIKNNR